MSARDGLESFVVQYLDQIGVRALGTDRKVRIDPNRDGFMISLALPLLRIDVQLDGDMLQLVTCEAHANYLLKQLDIGKRQLFAATIEHIAKHDHSPVDRVKDLEAASKALLEAMGALDDVRIPHGASSRLLDAAYRLRTLLQQKPGAASWALNGYGAEPAIAVEPTS